MVEPYSYTQEEDGDSGASGTFYSPKNKRLYSVTFESYLYREFLDDFPALLAKGYGLGFFHIVTVNTHEQSHDPSVSATITKIILDFLQSCGKDCVLLYHCDNHDGKQKCRHIIFERWYRNLNHANFIKEAVEVDVPISETKVEMHYLGYITHKDNPYLGDIKREFEAFSYNIIEFHNNKNQER